jgi:hypothetical protein
MQHTISFFIYNKENQKVVSKGVCISRTINLLVFEMHTPLRTAF